jgi:hypothetical protein
VYEGCPDAIHVKDEDGQIPRLLMQKK